jgi:hypothetical protein
VDGGEGFGSADRVVAESLDAQQAPVGGEADLPQRGQMGQLLRIPKSPVSLIWGLDATGSTVTEARAVIRSPAREPLDT